MILKYPKLRLSDSVVLAWSPLSCRLNRRSRCGEISAGRKPMIPSDSKPDVVIVGAGIAGSALAISLAGSGHSVTLLEKSTVHVDRFRGEFIVPWEWRKPKRSGFWMSWRAPVETTPSGRFHTARSFAGGRPKKSVPNGSHG